MRKLYFVLVAILFIACRQKDKSSEYRQLLQGDWVSGPTEEGSLYGPRVIISVEDSLMTMGGHGIYAKYTLQDDSLLTDTKADFRIFRLTQDSLIISMRQEDERLNDTFQLTRVRIKNALVPQKIFYSSSACFGSCPSMHLEIDSSGKFIFWGGSFTTYQRGYRGQLTPSQYQRVLEKVRQLPLDFLRELYEADWIEDQTAGVIIVTKDTAIRSTAYGFDREPVELRILLHKLSELYKTVDLHSDTTLKAKHFYLEGILIPPPIPPAGPGTRG